MRYTETVSELTTIKDYQNPVQPIRQKEPPVSWMSWRRRAYIEASSVGHRGTEHWSSTYKLLGLRLFVQASQWFRTSHDQNAVSGAAYARRGGCWGLKLLKVMFS